MSFNIFSINLSVFQAHRSGLCTVTTTQSLFLPLSLSSYAFRSPKCKRIRLTRIAFAAKLVCKRYCALISVELATCLKHVSYSCTTPSPPTIPLQHICQNEILLSAFAPHSPLPLALTVLMLSAHNSINCPKLTVRQPFIYLSNPLCRHSPLLLFLLLLLCFIPL